MIKSNFRESDNFFVETKLGIVTRYGDWFHITSEQIEDYVPGLLKRVSLEKLIGSAQAWVNSGDSLAMIFLLVLLGLINPWFAALVTLAFHFAWYFKKSAFITISLDGVIKFINSDGFLLITSLVVLSLLGMQGHYLAGSVGLGFFLILKLGLLKRLWNLVVTKTPTAISMNDRVLKMVIIKYSLDEGIPPSEVEEMEKRMSEMAFSKRKK